MKRPLREMVFTWEVDEKPSTYREIVWVAAGGLLEIGKALHRIADEMEEARNGSAP